MKLFAFFCALFLSLTAFAEAGLPELSFEHGALGAQLTWLTPPRSGEEAVLGVRWLDANGAPTEPNGGFTAQLWMPAMGHGSSPVVIQHAADERGQPISGAYRISRMFFIMEGDWEVRFTLKTKEMVAWPVSVGETR